MSFTVLLPQGLDAIEVTHIQGDFDPLVSTSPPQMSELWSVLPDDLAFLPGQDRAIIETVWQSLAQLGGDLLSRAMHLDRTTSLSGFPLNAPRRWLHWDTRTEVAFEAENTSVSVAAQDTRWGGFDPASGALLLTGRGSLAWAGLALRSRLRHDTHLAADASFSLVTPGADEGWCLLGWGDLAARNRSGVWVAVSSTGRMALVILRAGDEPESDRFDVVVCPDSAGGTEFNLQLELTPASLGGTPDFILQATLSGDAVVNWTYPVTLTGPGGAPVEAFADTWMVAPPWRALCDASVDMRSAAQRVQLIGLQVSYTDPTFDPAIRFIPVLRSSPQPGGSFFRQGFEYEAVRAPSTGLGYFRRRSQLAARLWAESVALDARLLRKIFAPFVGSEVLLGEEDTEELRSQIIGALYGLLAGPHLPALATAIGALLGAPIAVGHGTVVGFISPGGHPAVMVSEAGQVRAYPYPAYLKLRVALGDSVRPLDALVELPEVHDWVSSPGAVADRSASEIQKFSSLLVQIPSEYIDRQLSVLGELTSSVLFRFGEELSQGLAEYLERAVGVWCGALSVLLSVLSRFSDDLGVDEGFLFSARVDGDGLSPFLLADYPSERSSLSFTEGLRGASTYRYDVDPLSYGDDPGDVCNDPSIPVYDEHIVRGMVDALGFTLLYSGSDVGSKTVYVYGTSVTLEHGESATVTTPDDWLYCNPEVTVDLDFSAPAKSHWLPVI